jgi:hypothetical protein
MQIVRVTDSAGNEYNLPETKLAEFQRLDQEIVATYDNQIYGMSDLHMELCEQWFDLFGRYMIQC